VDGVTALLREHRHVEKTGLPDAEIRAAAAARSPLRIRGVIEEVALRLAAADRRAQPSTAILKSGAHLWVWRRIRRTLPDARFLFIVRDPRAVVLSKLGTERPYHAGQSMAWAGCAAAAVQWRWYARHADRIAATPGTLLEVRYEDLLAEPASVLERVGRFLGATVSGRGTASYRIAPAERSIHPLALEDGLATERAQAWRTGLGARECAVVERICGREMAARGYAALERHARPREWAMTAQEIARSGWRIGQELGSRAIARVRPGAGDSRTR
jgi:hypothetical protein